MTTTDARGPTVSATDGALETHAALFFRCFAIVLFFDRAVRGTTDGPHVFVTSTCALALASFPQSRAALCLLASSHASWFIGGYAHSTMVHWAVGFLGTATVLLALLVHAPRMWRERVWPSNGELFSTLRPILCAIVLVGLPAAGFAKLNRGFLDPELSCGALYYSIQRTVFPYSLLPGTEWARAGAIGFTICAELVAPWFLLHRRTRPVAVVVVSTFLFVIGTNPENDLYEFSGLFLAYGLAFAPSAPLAEQSERLMGVFAKARSRLAQIDAVRVAGMGAVVVTALVAGDVGLHAHRLWVCRALFVVSVPLVASMVVRATWQARKTRASWPTLHPILVVVPLVYFINEALPYVGLSHMPSMKVAGNATFNVAFSDHVVVRRVPRFAFNRPVTILESNDDRMRRGATFPWIVFAHLMAERPNSDVRFRVDDLVEHVSRAGDDPRFQSTSWIVRFFHLGHISLFQTSTSCAYKRAQFVKAHPEKAHLLPGP